MSSQLKLIENQTSEMIEICISGEVDIFTSQQLKDKLYAIADSLEKDLKLNCKELNYIDSTGLGVFVGTLKRAKQNNRKIFISNLKDNIKKLFLITDLNKLFIIE